MFIYGSENGTVEKGIFSGFRFRLSGSGRVVKATPWMKYQMGAISHQLTLHAIDVTVDEWPKTVFWEYFLDLAASPANGLHHQAAASTPLAEVVDDLLRQIRRGRI